MRSQIISASACAPSAGQNLPSLNIDQLKVGVKLRSPIYDGRNVLLLADGATITPLVIDRLTQRGITTVKVHRNELSHLCRVPAALDRGRLLRAQQAVADERTASYCPMETRHSRLLDATIERGRLPDTPKFGSAFAAEIREHGTEGYDPDLASKMVESHDQSFQQMERLFKSLESAKPIECEAVESISADNLLRIAADLDLFVSLGVSPAIDKYPARHGLQTSMLAMAIGTSMGLDRRSVMDMGTGCLVHDAGMLHINQRVVQAESALDPVAFIEITKHPILTFDLMRNVERLPGTSRIVAYQMHERCNGTGYPRRRQSGQIHQLAKIATVADVFVALVSPRPHRSGMMPYYAVEHLIRGAKAGLFDPQAVRAMLHTVSLFPTGSFVELNDGRVGRVIRSNGQAYMKPIVETWERVSLNSAPEVIDLSVEPKLAIMRPLSALPRSAEPSPEDDWD